MIVWFAGEYSPSVALVCKWMHACVQDVGATPLSLETLVRQRRVTILKDASGSLTVPQQRRCVKIAASNGDLFMLEKCLCEFDMAHCSGYALYYAVKAGHYSIV